MKNVAIIILNYNGYIDTIECLSSILELEYKDFTIFLVDNGSQDDSIQRLEAWADDHFNLILLKKCSIDSFCKEVVSDSNDSGNQSLLLIRNPENLGFAGGSNIGIKLALKIGFEFIWLLNNDTVVNRESLSVMVDYLQKNNECYAVTPQIRYYDDPGKVWNCGGVIKWYGARKYYYVNSSVKEIEKKESFTITFITGCAPLIRKSIFENVGLLTERFFFGEEDFVFSLKMKAQRKKMACCLNAIIYHKVGSSINIGAEERRISKIYIHYLNRFIHMRLCWNNMLLWNVWRLFYVIYIWILLIARNKLDMKFSLVFLYKLLNESKELDRVDKIKFDKILNKGWDYFK